jgi:hypothetical protein
MFADFLGHIPVSGRPLCRVEPVGEGGAPAFVLMLKITLLRLKPNEKATLHTVGYFDCVKGNCFRICSSSIMVLPPAWIA